MSYTRDKARTPYARALYAAAIAALLSACTQIDSNPAASAKETAQVAEQTDMPVVVVTASRSQPESRG